MWDECDRFTNTYTFSSGTNTLARFTIRLIVFASVRFSLSLSRSLHIRTRAHVEKRAGDVRTSPQRRNARTDLRRSRAAHNLHSHHSFR